MLKTHTRAGSKIGRNVRPGSKSTSSKKPAAKLTAEQQRRIDLCNTQLAEQKRWWDSLSPKEQRAETRAYERAMKSLAKYPLSLREYKSEDDAE